MTDTDMKKLETFQNTCLRRIHGIYWPNIITNKELLEKSNLKTIEKTIRIRRHKLLGHILRMENTRTPKVALRWTPATGRRRRGRPRMTWRRTVEKDLKEIKLSWNQAEAVARDRIKWRKLMWPHAPTEEL